MIYLLFLHGLLPYHHPSILFDAAICFLRLPLAWTLIAPFTALAHMAHGWINGFWMQHFWFGFLHQCSWYLADMIISDFTRMALAVG